MSKSNYSIKTSYSKNQWGFVEVLNDLKNADYLYISTYSFPEKDSILLDRIINEVPKSCDIKIVTNIPINYQKHKLKEELKNTKEESNRKKIEEQISCIRDKIKQSTNILNPKKFKDIDFEDMEVFINFRNHSKIIMTNNIAYIGSANFTSSSKYKYEYGVLIKDKSLLEIIKQDFINLSKRKDSTKFYGETIPKGVEVENVKIYAMSLLQNLKDIVGKFENSLYTYEEYETLTGNIDEKIYSFLQPDKLINYLNELDDILYILPDSLEELFREIYSNESFEIDLRNEAEDAATDITELQEHISYFTHAENYRKIQEIDEYQTSNKYDEINDEEHKTYVEIPSNEVIEQGINFISCLDTNIKKIEEFIEELENINYKDREESEEKIYD